MGLPEGSAVHQQITELFYSKPWYDIRYKHAKDKLHSQSYECACYLVLI